MASWITATIGPPPASASSGMVRASQAPQPTSPMRRGSSPRVGSGSTPPSPGRRGRWAIVPVAEKLPMVGASGSIDRRSRVVAFPESRGGARPASAGPGAVRPVREATFVIPRPPG